MRIDDLQAAAEHHDGSGQAEAEMPMRRVERGRTVDHLGVGLISQEEDEDGEGRDSEERTVLPDGDSGAEEEYHPADIEHPIPPGGSFARHPSMIVD